MFIFALHTGCRSGAVSSLRVQRVRDRNGIRAVGTVEEKGGVVREFWMDPVLARALEGAIAVNRGSPFVFPANRGVRRRPERQNDHWLRDFCARNHIVGDHVHMHALRPLPHAQYACGGDGRRTTISMLLGRTADRRSPDPRSGADAGNSIHLVSRPWRVSDDRRPDTRTMDWPRVH